MVKARGAVTVTELTKTEYDTTIAVTSAWNVHLQAGFPSSIPEVFVTRGGVSGTVTANHVWNQPEQFGLSYNEVGDLVTQLGSTQVTVQPIMSFNAIVIKVQDFAFFGPTGMLNLKVNGESFGNYLVDNNDSDQRAYRYLQITGFGDEVDITSALTMSEWSGSDDSTWTFTGVTVNVPEPSALLITTLGMLPMLLRRKRPAVRGRSFLLYYSNTYSHLRLLPKTKDVASFGHFAFDPSNTQTRI